MRNFISVLCVTALYVACQMKNPQLGDAFKVQQPITVNEVINKMEADSLLNNIQIEGKIDKSCMSEGCWFIIKDAANNEILFDVKDKAFRVPTNAAGRTAIILADVKKNPDSEQQMDIAVKGMMFK